MLLKDPPSREAPRTPQSWVYYSAMDYPLRCVPVKPQSVLLLLSLFALCMALFVVASPFPAAAQGNPTPTPPPPNAEDLLREARAALEAAGNAQNTVDFVLSFFEVAGLVITLLVSVATIAGVRTISEYRSELNKAREELNAMRQELKADTDRANTVFRDIEARINESIAAIKQRGEDTIRTVELLQLGEQQMESRNWRAALRTFEQALKFDPQNRATNYFLGELYIQQRDLERGLKHLQTSGTDFPPAEAAMAYALRLIGDQQKDVNERNRYYAQAEQHFINALNNDPQVRDIGGESFYGVLGGLYRRQGRIADAIRCYREAERLTPQSSYPVNNLAMLYLIQGDMQQADRYYSKAKGMAAQALNNNPSDYWSRFDLITASAALGEFDEAKHHLNIILENPPGIGPMESLLEGFKAIERTTRNSPQISQIMDKLQAGIEHVRAATRPTA